MARLALALGILLGASAARAQVSVGPAQQLVASDPAEAKSFGLAVAVDADTAVVGAPFDTQLGTNAGAAYVFARAPGTSGWVLQQKLTAVGGIAEDGFGTAVAVSGTGILVGAPGAGSAAGSAYLFRRSGSVWSQEQVLVPSGGLTSLDRFGASVSLSGTTALVGALGEDDDSGAAYVFFSSAAGAAQLNAKLAAPSPEAGAAFGDSVAVDGAVALIASPGSGQVFAFRRSGDSWGGVQSLSVSAPLSPVGVDDGFGSSVAVSGNWALVGAMFEETAPGVSSGAAYFFELTGSSWQSRQRVVPAQAVDFMEFGSAVSLSDGRAVVAAPLGHDELGEVHLFSLRGTAWQVAPSPIVISNAEPIAFGFSVGVSSTAAIAGAPSEACTSGFDCGSAYVFGVVDAAAAVPLFAGFGATLGGTALLAAAGVLLLPRRRRAWQAGLERATRGTGARPNQDAWAREDRFDDTHRQ